MKQLKYLLVSMWFLFTGCSSVYQVIETNSATTKLEKENFVFENAELKINYNFWSDGGAISFIITNKLEEAIYLDWNKSHFIYNGVSYEYWYDSEETKSFYSSSTVSTSATFADAMINILGGSAYGSGKSTTSAYKKQQAFAASSKFKPKQIIQIPPQSSILISKFTISKSPYFTCEFPIKYSGSKTPVSKTFSKENSPLLFRNYLTYSVKESFEQAKQIDNDFYISSVANMNTYVFKGKSQKEKYCSKSGTKLSKMVYPYPFKKPNAFFIKTTSE
ncbi:MAG TPA: hypothetical protein PKN75_01870 [Bacteroidia bacterium]|nr:hypothetical protein [Bacteroidia bacterium]HNU32322.1 hypothetical protein [Bacteroidia bacterium]